MNHYPTPTDRNPITTWAEADRPREKMQLIGRANLSDAELIAILLGSGSRSESAVDLAKRMLRTYDHDLNRFGKSSIEELKKFKGIGEAKAITVLAAMELGRRRQINNIKERPQIKSSRDAFQIVAPQLLDLRHEEFWILLLNRANRVIGRECISTGGVAGTVVDAKLVFKKAIEGLACSIVLCHNHPSGNLRPSQADLDLTKKLREAGKVLDCAVLDHLIVADTGYYSFADEGVL
ncbi:MAG: DNA repair protein RadC [Bacteroidota bacterium]